MKRWLSNDKGIAYRLVDFELFKAERLLYIPGIRAKALFTVLSNHIDSSQGGKS